MRESFPSVGNRRHRLLADAVGSLDRVFIVGFPAGPPATNCFLVAPAQGEECVVVDPGIGAEPELEDALREHRLEPVAVLLTHGHFDHTWSVVPVCGAKGIPAYIAPGDRRQLVDPWSPIGIPVGTPLFGRFTFGEPDDVRPLADGDVVQLAGLELAVNHTPGHTPGSVTFRHGLDLIGGDLLFAGSIGRTDFPGGSMQQMMDSLARVVLPLPDETVVWPGHGPTTTVGRERATNPFLQELLAS
jgi:glyoxylase-like metal-dependent hydrolase (beta-lactamase superfamily II)